MKVTVYATHRMTICYDGRFYITNYETWKTSLTMRCAIEIMKRDMRIHGFTSAVATDPETGEVLAEITKDDDED